MHNHVKEFHCIMPFDNISSILKHGILSYELTEKLPHRSVAMPEVQDLRDQKSVPGGLRLHQYANMYFHARNPMLFKRKDESNRLCVLQIHTEVSKAPGVVFADRNAASDYVRFLDPATQWQLLEFEKIFALDWRHPGNPVAYWQHRSMKCAEILVPHLVEPKFLVGAYVVNEVAAAKLSSLGFGLKITIDPGLFFN